jgi:hypothetical protein
MKEYVFILGWNKYPDLLKEIKVKIVPKAAAEKLESEGSLVARSAEDAYRYLYGMNPEFDVSGNIIRPGLPDKVVMKLSKQS